MKEDLVNHPKHYNSHPTGIECIELAQYYRFSIGNVLKYMWRAGIKKELGKDDIEKELEDIRKAIWYAEHTVQELENENPDNFDNLHKTLYPDDTQLIDSSIHPFDADPDKIAKYYNEHIAEAFRCIWWVGMIDLKYVIPLHEQIVLANKAILNLRARELELEQLLKKLQENE